VRQSSGHIKIYSELGEGTTIKIYLPRSLEGHALRNEDLATSSTARAFGAETVLVVEDDQALRAYTVETLMELGYRVLQAANGAEALAIIDHEQVDLLFTDVVMPGGLNGRQLAEEASKRRPRLKVLYTTGYARNAIVHHGRLDPGVHLVGKPFSYAELAAKVRAVLDAPL
jgi:CheY-like chemotaxis protein